MTRIDVEEKRRSNSYYKNSKWWIIALIVIVAILVAWISLSDRNRADVDTPPEPVVYKDKTGTKNLM